MKFKKDSHKKKETQENASVNEEIADAIKSEQDGKVSEDQSKDVIDELLVQFTTEFESLSEEEKINTFVARSKEAMNMTDLAKRTQADMINFRNRKETEFQDFKKFASASLIEKFIPLLDNFELALRNSIIKGESSYEVLKKYNDTMQGMELIYSQFISIMEDSGVVIINPVNHEQFDPHKHEALLAVKDESRKDGEIIEVMQKGYELSSRLIRAAKVKIVRN